jgi:ABC-type sugar transport system substrate-binding protein
MSDGNIGSIGHQIVKRRGFLRAAVGVSAYMGLIAACGQAATPAAPTAAAPAQAQPTAAQPQAQAQPTTAPAVASTSGAKRKVILVPQDAGDWNAPARVGCRDFCAMVGWDFQHLGNPVYSVENHVEQVNNAIATKPDIIITELESQGLVSAFQKAQAAGITMVIFDQGIDAEAAKLGVAVINQDEMAAGVINGTQAATVAHKTLGKTEGVIGVGNGNPGSTSIDKRQNGTKQGIEDYNKANGTNFTTDLFPDDEFFDANSSIQKWGAKLDQYGDKMVGMIAVGNPTPQVKALQTHGIDKGKVVVGSTDANPDILNLIDQGWVYWGIDQQFPVMGFYAVAAGWEQLERGFPTRAIRTGGDLVTKENLQKVKDRTDKWVALAKQYGDLK